MIYSYKECIKKYGNNYALMNALKNNTIYKIKPGIYSTNKDIKSLDLFIKEHKNVIFTMESAFYYLGISDDIPDKYVIATDKDSTKYKNKDIVQYFMNNGLTNIGICTIKHSGIDIKIYNKERMLIELVRYKNKLPYDFYKEIVNYYRNNIDEIDVSLVLDYLESFPKKDKLKFIIQSEVL